jgi:hypothetical protein
MRTSSSVKLRLTGLQITRHTVKLPQDLILALRDEATSKRVRTSFNLLDRKSKVRHYLRLRTDKNRKQHAAFLAAVTKDSVQYKGWVK